MTSVQSHLPLLSGSRSVFYLFIFSVLFGMSCASSKSSGRVLKPTQTKTPTTTTKTNPNKVDTIQWSVIDKEKYPPITNADLAEINPLNRPIDNITMLVPFEVRGNTSALTRSEEKFAHFYAGALVAIAELEELNRPFTLNIYDTKRDLNYIQRLLQNMDVRQSDVIVGPYETKNLQAVATWGKQNDKPVISPWRSSSSIAEDNPYYYQMRPLIEQYFEAILSDALNKYDPSDIHIINNESKDDDARVRAFHKIHEAKMRGKINSPLNEYSIVADSIQNADFLMFDSLFLNPSPKAIIIPNYSSRDARYVYSLIRKINAEIDVERLEIYGMPTLFNAERLDLEFFRSLNLLTVDFKLTDHSKPEVKSFVKKYFSKFGHLPNDDSYHGYDTVILLANSSDYASSGGSAELSQNLPFLSIGAQFQPYDKNRLSSKNVLSRKRNDFMVNTKLQLIKYENNRFRSVPIR